MKKYFLLLIILLPLAINNCRADSGNGKDPGLNKAADPEVVKLTNDSFKKLVFNYEMNKEWKFEGKKPAIVDFYADWCSPCRQLAPVIEEIAKEYAGKIDVYKVDTEKERVLAQNLGITSLPTLIFIPVVGNPQVAMGALPKETLVKAINDVLLIK